MSTEYILSRHVSRLKTESKRGEVSSENTYRIAQGILAAACLILWHVVRN